MDTYVRIVNPDDAAKLLEIYAPYVEDTAISFEYTVPSLEEFRRRIRGTLEMYPYIAICREGGDGEEILGYSYTGAFKDREAYQHDVETTVYIRRDQKKNGLGRKIYTVLEEISKRQNVSNMYACIGYPAKKADEYLDTNSADFHQHIGYQLCGRFHRCGFKFGRIYDMIWMEKLVADPETVKDDFIPFPELGRECLRSCGVRC